MKKLQQHTDQTSLSDLENIWSLLTPEEKALALLNLPRSEAEDYFFTIPSQEKSEIIQRLPQTEQRSWVRLMAPDELTDAIQHISTTEEQKNILALLDEPTRKEVTALLSYVADEAGGLMNPAFSRLRPDVTVDEAITYLKQQTRKQKTGIYYIYVLDQEQRLLGVISYRDLFAADSHEFIRDIMKKDVIKVEEHLDQEVIGQLFAKHNLLAMPVVDSAGRIKGVITVDDVIDVIREEATEDIQKIGGAGVLDLPYMSSGIFTIIRKRAGWLAVLFLGEMLTASAMGYFEHEIAKAVILALFIPLIISSGGNSGAQASTLIIRAMALQQIKLRDWHRVIKRELFSGLMLGLLLGFIGFTRVVVWENLFHIYGDHYILVATTVFLSLIGVVSFGTITGSMLPFLLRKLGFDPASASAPFVATLVDVTGLVIYFSIAAAILSGTLL